MVSPMMLEGAGFEIFDLGVDATVENVIKSVRELQPQVLGLSALLTTTMPEMERVINALEKEGVRDRVKVMVGGAPVVRSWAEEIGSDGYGRTTSEAIAEADRLVE